MTLAACLEHTPMHVFGKGYFCAKCGVELPVPRFLIDADAPISPETQRALDDIDANIRAAHVAAKSTFLD